MKNTINPFTPGLVIMPDGEIITMKESDDTHIPFFQKIIKQEYQKTGMPADGIDEENNLAVLSKILLEELQILPYQGCTSGDRKYTDGHLFISSLDTVTNQQLPAIIDLYTTISSQYVMHITKVDFDDYNHEEEISLGEIFEEMSKRPSGKTR